ncbi:MAG: flagellar biosynthesis protein FlgF [Gammaproteobacteria bacterium SG8_11]|nr:MAG: flagellar biosynthesis protein FlgF [Gammaproteobacteria bacterium SG8_11]
MDRMLYVAMSGAKQTMLAQQANNHNMANVNTTGFLADLNAFRSMQAFGPGYESRVYAMTERPSVDFTAGFVNHTGRDLDIAVEDNGFIAVLANDGTEAYTRAGDLRVESGGQLVTGAGLPVMGNGGPIAIPPAQKITIGGDGTISIVPVGQPANAQVIVDRIKLVSEDEQMLTKGSDGLVRHKEGIELEADASLRVISGTLQSSNVNVVDSMVNMISLARQYEAQVKLMKTADEMDSQTDRLLQLS